METMLKNLPVEGYPCGREIVLNMNPQGQGVDAMKTQVVDVDNMPFKKALAVEIMETQKFLQWISLSIETKEPVKEGDTLFLSLYMKCEETKNETGQGLLLATVRKEWQDRVLEMEFSAGDEWVHRYVGGKAGVGYDPGEARLFFMLGYRPQKILIADVQLVNLGQNVQKKDIPLMPLGYHGMEPNAPWRKAAEERIEKYRKSDMEITVRDENGAPVPDADVSVKLTRHAFGFGGPYSGKLHESKRFEIDIAKFQENFKRCFNKAVIPNELKWKQYRYGGDKTVHYAYDWLSANNIPARGHCLIWPGWKYMPDEVKAHQNNPEKLRQLTMERIEDVLGDWRGKLVEWDVTNELYMQHDLMDICGNDIIVEWYKKARECDPDTKLYYNDANTFANNQPGHQDHYYEMIEWLLKKGAPIDGMGFQCHIHSLVGPEVISKRIERFSQLGPEIQITEFDIQTPGISDELQAQYARDFMTVVYSHPKTVGIVTWLAGMPLRTVESFHRGARSQCAFYNSDWSLRPIGEAWLDLKENVWMTDEDGKTDSNGKFSTRGFQGEYELLIKKDGKTLRRTIELGKEEAEINIAF